MQGSQRTHPEWRCLSSRLYLYPQFHSRFLPDDRDLTIYLPPGYNDSPGRAYPVLFMHDGQNLFEPVEATPGLPGKSTWQLAEAADSAILAKEVEPLLIVGVANTGERRLAEYTPTADWKMGGGEADPYGRLLVKELLPFIAARFRVKPGAANTGLGGSSLGGLATLYLGLKYPAVFGKLAVLSPSVWWNHRAILALIEEIPKQRSRPRIWLDIGDAEGERSVSDTDLLEQRLRANGWLPGSDLKYQRIPGGAHNEAAWARRVRPMLRFLFPGPAAKASN